MSKKLNIKELLRKTSLSYTEIGDKLGCSKQYVSQVAKEYGLNRSNKSTKKNINKIKEEKSFSEIKLNTNHIAKEIEHKNMNEKLYQPDFNCIFGKKYANAFIYPQIDSLVWPIFNDMEFSDSLKKLLDLENSSNRKYFYRRKITIEDEKVESACSDIGLGLLQAMELGREYGISNSDVMTAIQKAPTYFRGILSYDLSINSVSKEILSDLSNKVKENKIAGIVIYPSYTKLDLADDSNTLFKDVLSFCQEKDLFIKIDLGNLFLPENYPEYTSHEKLKSFLSKNEENIFIISGLDISGDFNIYYQLLKYFNNLWIEIDPRTFGGMTPTDCFKQIFMIKGFVQNCWHRMIIGSATPTLEMSQVVRGFLEATETLPISQKCILRTWALRNVNRLNSDVFPPFNKDALKLCNTVLDIDQNQIIENDNEIDIIYKIKLRSYSITQLIFLTDLINTVLNKTTKKYPNLANGELLIRSYHTTTSLVVNEHEYGNYLDLHYRFAELSKQDSSSFLHTVKALENRSDFNHFDHELASTYGSRQLIIPILNSSLEIGGRENFYVLVTFGPRTFQILIKIKLIKEK